MAVSRIGLMSFNRGIFWDGTRLALPATVAF